MSILTWILFGLVSGFIASKLVNNAGDGPLLDIVLGVVGAVIGGYFFNMHGARGITSFNAWSVMVAVVGATALLVVYHAVTRHRAV